MDVGSVFRVVITEKDRELLKKFKNIMIEDRTTDLYRAKIDHEKEIRGYIKSQQLVDDNIRKAQH